MKRHEISLLLLLSSLRLLATSFVVNGRRVAIGCRKLVPCPVAFFGKRACFIHELSSAIISSCCCLDVTDVRQCVVVNARRAFSFSFKLNFLSSSLLSLSSRLLSFGTTRSLARSLLLLQVQVLCSFADLALSLSFSLSLVSTR